MTSATSTTPPVAPRRRGPGRPRDLDLDRQVLAAVLGMVDAGEEVTVARVVALSGCSRAALYRRWPSVTALVAAALDVGRTVPPDLPTGGDLREALFAALVGDPGASGAPQLSAQLEARFRRRIQLVMADRELQRAYWASHVALRRRPVAAAIRAGVDQGLLRADLDVEACIDALAGAAYYQLVVRGERPDAPACRPRMQALLDTVWRGMLA